MALCFKAINPDFLCSLEKLLEQTERMNSYASLEKFLSKQLGLNSSKSFNPDEYNSTETKSISAVLAAWNSENLEDFQLTTKKAISDKEIEQALKSYFESELEIVTKGFYKITKNAQDIGISVSNYSSDFGKIMISVLSLP